MPVTFSSSLLFRHAAFGFRLRSEARQDRERRVNRDYKLGFILLASAAPAWKDTAAKIRAGFHTATHRTAEGGDDGYNRTEESQKRRAQY